MEEIKQARVRYTVLAVSSLAAAAIIVVLGWRAELLTLWLSTFLQFLLFAAAGLFGGMAYRLYQKHEKS